MKALQITRLGSPTEVVAVVDLPEPAAPGSGEALIQVEYAPINFSELLRIMGRYGLLPTSFPAGAGNEGVARVLGVGKGVAGLKPGDRVLVPSFYPAWSERLVVPTAMLAPLPADSDPQQLAMLAINPPTAALMLSEYGDLRAGDWIIQNAGNSGVGRSVIAIAKSRGLRTMSTVRRAELVDELIAAGGDIILQEGPDLATRVAAATKRAKVRLALDGVAGESGAALAGCLAPGGTLVVYSFMSGHPVTVGSADLIFRDLRVRAFWLYSPQMRESPKVAPAIALGARLISEGKLKVPIAATYPLEAAKDALAHALKGGKVLLHLA